MDGRKIRDEVRAASEQGYLDVALEAPQALPAILRAVNEIAVAATGKLAEEAGYGEGARLATARRAMLAAINVVAEALAAELPERVKDLKDEGVTWREIGELLDLTPEGAQRRFDPVAAEKARAANRRARQRQREAQGPGANTPRSPGSRRRSRRSDDSA